MTPEPRARSVADRLLDAQVEYVVAELTGVRLAENITRDVDDVLALAATMRLADVVDRTAVKATVRLLVERVGDGTLAAELAPILADAAYGVTTGTDATLGEVIAREHVEELVTKLLSMRDVHERLLERLTDSPLVATMASRFVAKIVADFVAQNRARAEKLPGMSSLLSIGTSAASKVRGAADQLIGEVAGKGAQYALRRTNAAVLEVLHDPSALDTALEVWDLHAAEPIGRLDDYLAQQDLRDLATIVHRLVTDTRTSEFAGEVLDAGVDAFFDRWGDTDLAALLAEAGISRDDLVGQLQVLAPPIVEAAVADGVLAGLVRARLEPFFRSPEVADILG